MKDILAGVSVFCMISLIFLGFIIADYKKTIEENNKNLQNNYIHKNLIKEDVLFVVKEIKGSEHCENQIILNIYNTKVSTSIYSELEVHTNTEMNYSIGDKFVLIKLK